MDLPVNENIRPELSELFYRLALGSDEKRPKAVDSRHRKNQRTARENIEDLLDTDSFIEFGALNIAAQRSRKKVEELMVTTPADGLIAGVGTVNAADFGEQPARCVVLSYDYTVLAGTQGFFNHKKMDRLLKLANEQQIPLIFFAEGGGGRPGDIDAEGVMITGLDLSTFGLFGSLSGKIPLVGIVSGFCFAGNAALLGCCDVIIAAENSNIGMGGPVMIEGGGLGKFAPEEIGPSHVQSQNGVIDIVVKDEACAVAVAKQYLSYFQGETGDWEAEEQVQLRDLIPENRRRTYDVRKIITVLADTGSFLELKPMFGLAMITGFLRIEGKPFGIMANNCQYMGGTIEADDADKASRLMQLCNAHGLPVISLIDTPGFMVGPEIEQQAQVRHVCRMFINGSHLIVPFFSIVLRRAYGLGSMAMARGGFHESFFTASWPTGEFGPMGLEGAVKVGFKRELDAIADPLEREAYYNKLVAKLYERGKAINIASHMEIDSVIDPVDTRKWIMRGLKSALPKKDRPAFKPFVDSW